MKSLLVLLLLTVAAAAQPLYLIYAHGPAGQDIEINVIEISSIRQPREGSQAHFAPGTKCLVYMSNGQFISTTETCPTIVKMIAALNVPKNLEKQ